MSPGRAMFPMSKRYIVVWCCTDFLAATASRSALRICFPRDRPLQSRSSLGSSGRRRSRREALIAACTVGRRRHRVDLEEFEVDLQPKFNLLPGHCPSSLGPPPEAGGTPQLDIHVEQYRILIHVEQSDIDVDEHRQ
eukprot:Gb_24376 [translate_table: standard]